MANALYDYKVTEDYEVSVGGGIGFDNINYDNTAGWHSFADPEGLRHLLRLAIHRRRQPPDAVLGHGSLPELPLHADRRPVVPRIEVSDGDLHNDDYSNLSNHLISVGVRFQ
jgi:hypothetical protein